MSIRIDPLTKAGTFDHELYSSEEYPLIKNVALEYICDEGFNEVPGEYTIVIRDQIWFVSVK